MTLRALIVEDEPLAARRLADMLARQPEPVQVLGTAESVAQAVGLLESTQPAPDVLFLDIHLADGLSFELFERTPVRCPVIFTTAYDQYALQAFKVNSVDYLLKPIDEEELSAALRKLRALHSAAPAAPAPAFDPALLGQLLHQMQQATPGAAYKTQFVVRVGEHLKVVPLNQVAYFFSLEKATFLQTTEGRKYVVDYTMDQLENLLDPRRFFRLNRAYLAQQTAIQDIIHYTNSRLQTVLKPLAPDTQVLVSREKVNVFKSWLDR
ncbi:LytTR family DNA-binding domain-containing protein [Hymenobacter sp. BT770]|uniref:LytR/AlgR family response regulator transcription factor n=1 Tax=Hymenobacter sp. BT770 TaxID=2886942 RepID=UPI001D11C66B|nr:LytTR family DNA-binding domain-containing protein [Hymenobacter sp. BT770]MCC3154628.1 LytTR family DNA-binding domain-containing protein [Hymenobacter sp. BT770]MDO3416681.1 LytTR family DNA-binding domain-containing protein [Hymenobacter sp. BT770]